jgi:hypothetical protein
MARMDSPAGEMEVKVSRVEGINDEIVVTSRFGAWDSKIYFSPEELAHVIRLVLNPSVIWFLFRFPFVLMARRLFRKQMA